MAKQTQQLILETQSGLAEMQAELESAMRIRDEYNRQLENARARLRRKEKSTYPDRLAEEFIKETKLGNVLEVTLMKWIDDAITVNNEFADEEYVKALYSVAKNPEIYKFIKRGSGWETSIDLQIVFEEVAGGLNDWAQAVIDYREFVLKTRGLENEASGERATDWWLSHVYDSGLASKTIKGRLMFTPTEAPFWEILNSGTHPMKSDRPGSYTAVSASPTDFIGDAEREIEDQFLNKIRQEYSVWFEETKELKEIINQFQEKRDEYSYDISNLKTELQLNQQIYSRFADKAKFIDQHKMIDVVKRLRAGEEFEKPKVNIGVKGKRIYITVRSLEGTIEI